MVYGWRVGEPWRGLGWAGGCNARRRRMPGARTGDVRGLVRSAKQCLVFF